MTSLAHAQAVMRSAGLDPKPIAAQYESATVQSLGAPSLADHSLFEMYGVEQVRAFDHSDFEGADIVVDLTKDISDDHAGTADFIFDGSVMDNIFRPDIAMANVAKILRPGGRYFGFNAASTRALPAYVAFNPYWFFDFFVANGFADVKVYVLDYSTVSADGNWADIRVDLLDCNADHRSVLNFPVGPNAASLLIIAEKAADSTHDRYFSQACYRLPHEWAEFDRNIARVQASDRPPFRLRRYSDSPGGAAGFNYVGNIDTNGQFNRPPGEQLPNRRVIDLGGMFPGYDWGARGQYDGMTWRWIDGESAVLLARQTVPFRIRASVHTADSAEAINAVRLRYAGRDIPARVEHSNGRYTILADAPPHEQGPLTFCGRGVALSRVEIIPSDR